MSSQIVAGQPADLRAAGRQMLDMSRSGRQRVPDLALVIVPGVDRGHADQAGPGCG